MLAERYLKRRYAEGKAEGIAEGLAEGKARIRARLLEMLERGNGRGLTREDVERALESQTSSVGSASSRH